MSYKTVSGYLEGKLDFICGQKCQNWNGTLIAAIADQMVGASYHWDRPVFPLQKAFCEALAGRDAVWALSTLPSLSLFSFMDVGVLDVSATQDLGSFWIVDGVFCFWIWLW